MSEIKSPFLDNESTVKKTDDSKIFSSKKVVDNLISDEDSKEETGSIEIKDNGKTLRNIIVAMIVLLVLTLLGLLAYNLFNRNNKSINPDSLNKETIVEVTNFEMKGTDFRANSIVIEQ